LGVANLGETNNQKGSPGKKGDLESETRERPRPAGLGAETKTQTKGGTLRKRRGVA